MRTRSPIVTFPRTFAPVPMFTWSPTVGPQSSKCFCELLPMPRVTNGFTSTWSPRTVQPSSTTCPCEMSSEPFERTWLPIVTSKRKEFRRETKVASGDMPASKKRDCARNNTTGGNEWTVKRR